MSASTAKKLFATPPEIAVELGVRPETIVGWIKSGELPAVDFSRPDARKPRFKVRRDDLKEFLARRSVRTGKGVDRA